MTTSQKVSTPPTQEVTNNNEAVDPIQQAFNAALATLEVAASAPLPANARKIYAVTEFFYDTMQENRYWCEVDLKTRGADGIDALVPQHMWKEGYDANNKHKLLRPSQWLRRAENDHVVEGSTWWPGKPRIIPDVIVTEEGVINAPGARCFNTYREPEMMPDGDAKRGADWRTFLVELFGKDAAAYLVWYFAHLIQRPFEKCNAIVALTGDQGIGKDTALEAVRNIVGPSNCKEIAPDMLFDNFDPWKQSLLLTINEARPQNSEHMQTQFYEKLKVLGAAPPHWLHVNAKFERPRYVRNTMRTVITFNNIESLFIPEDDRRIFVARSQRARGWLGKKRLEEMHSLSRAGAHHVAAFLRGIDLSEFNPFDEPPRLEGWVAVSATWNEREGDVLYEALSELDFPEVVFTSELMRTQTGGGLDSHKELLKRVRSPFLATNMKNLGYNEVSKQRDDGTRRTEWSYGARSSKSFFRSRSGFLRKDVFSQDDSAQNAARLDAHGRMLVGGTTDET